MKPFLVFTLLLSLPCLVSAQNKKLFDRADNVLYKSAESQEPIPPEYLIAGSDYMEISLSRDGYFTIGTTNGASAAALDDHCQITYGHPFAMTSYPVFKIDGSWYRFDTFFSIPESLTLAHESGTLMLFGSNPPGLKCEYFLVAKSMIPVVEMTLQISNLDTRDHTVGGGLFFDPALGMHGDGFLRLGSDFILNDSLFHTVNPADSLWIWEKRIGAKGLGIKLDNLDDTPETIIAANWDWAYRELSPEYATPVVRALYDLLLKIYWPEKVLEPGEVFMVRMDIDLITPDFSSPAFCRWDLPSFLSMENNLLFPETMKSVLSINNTKNYALEDLTVNMLLSSPLRAVPDTLHVSIAPDQTTTRQVSVWCDLAYEDLVVNTRIDVLQGDMLLDQLLRPIYIPATPISDTGLVIVNDSISTVNFPDVDIIFSCEVSATGQRLVNLNNNNIFLYENENRIRDFSLAKYQGGGLDEVDFVFVLDVTGSMSDEINEVKNNILEFTDSLSFKGVDFRLAMVTFLDEIENVYNFTSDANLFKSYVDLQYAHGGGDTPENSLQALMTASQMEFRPAARRIFIWITDADFHEADWATTLTAETVVNELLKKSIIVHCVGSPTYQTSAYNRIIIPLAGDFYDIYGNFRDVLFDIANIRVQDRYELKYTSKLQAGGNIGLGLEIHYGGLGVIKTYSVATKSVAMPGQALTCYPNPFNPEITFDIHKSYQARGELKIYDILGRLVCAFKINRGMREQLIWGGKSSDGRPVGSGFYLVQLLLEDPAGQRIRESAKILFLK